MQYRRDGGEQGCSGEEVKESRGARSKRCTYTYSYIAWRGGVQCRGGVGEQGCKVVESKKRRGAIKVVDVQESRAGARS